jgi:hypothetical protein
VNENTSYAQALARHVKAALLRLREGEKIAEAAGTDLGTSEHDVPEAGLFRAAGDAAQDLDLWASCNARAQGAPDAATPGWIREGGWAARAAYGATRRGPRPPGEHRAGVTNRPPGRHRPGPRAREGHLAPGVRNASRARKSPRLVRHPHPQSSPRRSDGPAPDSRGPTRRSLPKGDSVDVSR